MEGPGLSLFTRFHRPPDHERTAPEDDPAEEPGSGRWRTVAAWALTALACLLVLFALIAPNDVSRYTPGAFVRIPLEGLLGVALVLVLPGRAKKVAASVAGVVLGLLSVVKVVD